MGGDVKAITSTASAVKNSLTKTRKKDRQTCQRRASKGKFYGSYILTWGYLEHYSNKDEVGS